MKYEIATILIAYFGLATASPIPEARNVFVPPHRMLRGREVPQEHSHEQFITTVRASININNPQGLKDPVFGLLGDAAAKAGLGQTTDPDCLQQATADQAFTNAKAAKDVAGMTAALIYRALERNTPGVGTASLACKSVTAVNPEIAAISQHQDPASPGAAANNKAVTLELAKQIASIGGTATDALKAGTFKPGQTTDTTGKGNTCDTTDDPVGCIFSQNLLVEDATAAEIAAAVSGVAASSGSGKGSSKPAASGAKAVTPPAATSAAAACAAPPAATVSAAAVASATTGSKAATTDVSGTNVQTFTGALGGIKAIPVIFTAGAARPFAVDNTTDINKGAALQRSCSVQHNQCATAANSGALAGGEAQCETQEAACNALI
jgi:hypothetical protein